MLRYYPYTGQRDSLLQQYCLRLRHLVEHDQAELAAFSAAKAARRAAEANVAMATAQSADRAKSEFLAHMSHELRTPLNAIIGFSDMIRLKLEHLPEAGKLIEYARDINGAGWHLLGVINDVLDLAKIEAGKFELADEPVDIADAVDACLTMLEVRMAQRSLTCDKKISRDVPPVLVDPRKFKQVLINLLSNAVKFTPEGGRIEVRAAREPSGGLSLTVSDNGIGMSPEEIPSALRPFVQLDSRVSRKHEGTGLGLPLSKALVELHGGSLSIESQLGKGTSVTVTLPAARMRTTQ